MHLLIKDGANATAGSSAALPQHRLFHAIRIPDLQHAIALA